MSTERHPNVLTFGADNQGDVSCAFQAAVNALPAEGGEIDVPDGRYEVDQAPAWGNKSVYWNFGPNVVITGRQDVFPRMLTNKGQVPVGPWIQSRSAYPSPNGGGIAALNAEMIQPASYVGQSVALYAGAQGENKNRHANVWAINSLINAMPQAGGTYQNIEADVNNYSANALVKGISINGIGRYDPEVALEVIRSDASKWKFGVHILDASTGVSIDSRNLRVGLAIGQLPGPGPVSIFSEQLGNGADTILLKRANDTHASGYFLRAVDAQNKANIYTFDVNGNASLASIRTSGSGAMPLYDVDGKAVPSPHMLSGSRNLRAGQLKITLAGSAMYSAASSYTCTASDTAAPYPVSVREESGSTFSLTGNGDDMIQFICVGN